MIEKKKVKALGGFREVVRVEALAGSTIRQVLDEMSELSKTWDCPVLVKFNDKWLVVDPASDPVEVEDEYWAKPHRMKVAR